jgi:HK97 family phage major capsid protein
MAEYKGQEIDTTPSDAMVEEAERGLAWREEFGRGGTRIGVARARDIANRRELSVDTVRRMSSYFARHAVDKQAEGFDAGEDGYPSAGRIAWALWGGDPGEAFARRVMRSVESIDGEERQVSGATETALENKVEEHNEEHGDSPTKRVTLGMLVQVYERGVGAYQTNPESVRPSVSSPEQWAMARVNSFLYAVRNERFRSGKHDTDLFPDGHPLKSDDDARGSSVDILDQSESLDSEREAIEQERAVDHRHIVDVEETEDSIIVEFAKHAEEAVEEPEEVSVEEPADRESAVEVLHRSMHMDPEAIDEEGRRVRMSISSEAPVERAFGMEVLDHSEESIDMDFLRSGHAPLLLDHDPERQIGVIESVELDGEARRLRANVRFGRGALAEEVYRDVLDGIRGNVSIGYTIKRMKKGADEYRAMSWRPVEASIVSIPADVTVGVGRSGQPQVTVKSNSMEAQMSDQDIAAIEAEARKAAQKSAAQIIDLAARHNRTDLGQKAIAEGRSIEEFRGELLEAIGSERALEDQDVGLTKPEVQRFSLVRAINALANPTDRRAQEAAAFEFECSRAASQQYGRAAQGILLPAEVLRNWTRDLNSTDEAALFTDDFRPQDFIDVLRNQSSVMRAGARMLQGLSGDVKIPKKTAAASAGWINGEGGASGESEMTVGSVSMTPNTVGVHTDITRQLLIQSSMDVEALVRDDLATGIALAIDAAGLEGSGTSGVPEGILNTSGVNTVTAFAAANPTFSEVVTLETAVADANALMGNLSYILPSAMYGALKTTEKATNTAQFVVEPGGTVNGYSAIVSNQGTAGNLYFGNFDDLLIGFFGGLDIVVDPYTASTSGTVRVVALQSVDVAVRHAVSFAFGNDGV